MSDLTVPNIVCFQTQKQLATLNSMGVLLKPVNSTMACSPEANSEIRQASKIKPYAKIIDSLSH